MRGRLLEFPVSYGYDIGGLGSTGRQIRRSSDSGSARLALCAGRGKESGPRKASKIRYYVPVPNPTQVGGC